MGFGGVKQSGTGWKEAGVEALDVYSETQYVNLVVDPALSVSAAPIAVLGPGGVGGVLAARTGGGCASAPTGRSTAIRARGLALVHDGERTVTRPGGGRAPRGAGVAPRRGGEGVRPRRGARARRAVGAPRTPSSSRSSTASSTSSGSAPPTCSARASGATVVAGSIGRVEAYAAEPGRRRAALAGRARHGGGRRGRPPRVSTRALAPLRVPGIDVVVATGERAVLWEKAARLAVLAAATVASGLTVGALRADPGLARASARGARRGVRGRRRRRRPARPGRVNGRSSTPCPRTLTTSTARDARAGRPTELDAITGSVRAGR